MFVKTPSFPPAISVTRGPAPSMKGHQPTNPRLIGLPQSTRAPGGGLVVMIRLMSYPMESPRTSNALMWEFEPVAARLM